MVVHKDQTDQLSLIEADNEFVQGVKSMKTSLWQIFTSCCNILCVTEYVTMYLYFNIRLLQY